MFGGKNKAICGYWDCNINIPNDELLCSGHQEKWVEGLIDRCPKCGRFKDITFYLCLDCYVGRQVKPGKASAVNAQPRQQYRIEYSDLWTDGFLKPNRCFIFILEFDNGALYVGHTRDIHRRLHELRERKTSVAAGHKHKLQYLEMAESEKAAELREAELKRLMETNPTQIQLMFSEFHRHVQGHSFDEEL